MSSTELLSAKEPALCATINDAARLLGLCRTRIYELIASGDLKSVKIGRRRLVNRASLEQLVNGVAARLP
ncbi:MAG: helix-turn-helix domain-containing protein [Methylocella sp.]|nr:MAG: hypothetical protein DLM68_16635 [Hyphomicrobiales bacterium]